MPVHLRVLGPLRAEVVGDTPREARLTQPRPLALLTYLALARPRGPHPRDSLIALLWPEADQETALLVLLICMYFFV
jgi:DNA-binding SARP family transcriptional activator